MFCVIDLAAHGFHLLGADDMHAHHHCLGHVLPLPLVSLNVPLAASEPLQELDELRIPVVPARRQTVRRTLSRDHKRARREAPPIATIESEKARGKE